jgi:hypothetical protein
LRLMASGSEFPQRSRSDPIDWSEIAQADCTVPETPQDVEQLAKSILHRKRDFWIVVLTARRLETMPAVSPMVVREIVGPTVPVIFLRSLLATHLATLLPPKLLVYGGALRVYRPEVTEDPFGHPLLYDPTGEYGEEIVDWLGRIFTPSVTRPPKLTAEERVVVLEEELDRANRMREREVGPLRARYERLVLGAEPGRGSAPWRRSGRQLGEELRGLIEAQWASWVPESERRTHPLRQYTVTGRFLEDVRGRVGDSTIDQVAWVCALVLCRFDTRRLGLGAGPLRPSPDGAQLTREDGARAWWCNLRRGAKRTGPRIVYWAFDDGTAELLAVGFPKESS